MSRLPVYLCVEAHATGPTASERTCTQGRRRQGKERGQIQTPAIMFCQYLLFDLGKDVSAHREVYNSLPLSNVMGVFNAGASSQLRTGL